MEPVVRTIRFDWNKQEKGPQDFESFQFIAIEVWVQASCPFDASDDTKWQEKSSWFSTADNCLHGKNEVMTLWTNKDYAEYRRNRTSCTEFRRFLQERSAFATRINSRLGIVLDETR